MTQNTTTQRFTSDNGAEIYRIPMTVFPNGFVGYSYIVLNAGPPTMIDTGSGIGTSNDDLLCGFDLLRDEHSLSLKMTDIERILITHGHIDHFGGVAFAVEQTGGARVGIHELDRRVLTNYEERVTVATKDLRVYLERAGIPQEQRANLMEMYGFAKRHFQSISVEFSLEEDMFFEGLHFIHTPGHCPGQVCIKIGDILLSADHVLSHTTPHQAPESITHYTGLGHYRDSLRKIAKVDGVRLALGGHEDPIENFYERVLGIFNSHDRKLNRVLDIIRNYPHPATIAEITQAMYPDKSGYETLLALEEAGAHIEYLYAHGQISVANLEEVAREDNPPLRYVAS